MKAITNPRNYTEGQRNMLIHDWQNIADEGGLFYFGDGYISFYGSEIATLRLFKYYSFDVKRISTGYSENLKTHFFTLEF